MFYFFLYFQLYFISIIFQFSLSLENFLTHSPMKSSLPHKWVIVEWNEEISMLEIWHLRLPTINVPHDRRNGRIVWRNIDRILRRASLEVGETLPWEGHHEHPKELMSTFVLLVATLAGPLRGFIYVTYPESLS